MVPEPDQDSPRRRLRRSTFVPNSETPVLCTQYSLSLSLRLYSNSTIFIEMHDCRVMIHRAAAGDGGVAVETRERRI